MKTRALAILVFALVGAAHLAAEDAAKDEMKKLEGTWTVESASMEGQANDKAKSGLFIITGDVINFKNGDKDDPTHYSIDPSKKPKELDLIPTPTGDHVAGLYELDGDTLKLCIGMKERPKELTDKGAALFVLKRKK